MAVSCGIFHYLAPGAPCCPCLRILLIFPLLPPLAHTHKHTHSLSLVFVSQAVGSCGLLSVVHASVRGSVSDSSRLHGLSSPQLWLLHRGYHPPQDQPPQPGRSALLPAGERSVCVCLCVWRDVNTILNLCLYILMEKELLC